MMAARRSSPIVLLQWSQFNAQGLDLAAQPRETRRVLVHDGRHERGVGDAKGVRDVLGRTRTTRRDDRNRDSVADGDGQVEVVAAALPVLAYGGQQDLAGAAFTGLDGPGDRRGRGGDSPTVGVHHAGPGVNRHDDRLRAKACRDASSTDRTPPPTVKGISNTSATRSTTEVIVALSSGVAVMSSRTSSSAP